MAAAIIILVGMLTLQNVLGMTSDTEIKKLLELESDEPKLDSIIENDKIHNNKNVHSQRQKRWYENSPYNYPPPFPRPYNRELELESSLLSIRSSLEQILNVAKSSPPPPPPSFYPVYVPVYIPQPVCGCNPIYTEQPPAKAPEQPPINTPEQPTTNQESNNETVPDLSDRFPEMEDERQNWGLLINNTVTDYDDDDDGNRPISLGSISTKVDGGPSVEHGSSQADVKNPETQQSSAFNPPIAVASTVNSSQRSCDTAVLSCCFGPDKTYECIQSRGCQDQTLRQTPCDPMRILPTITRLQSYYKS